MSRILVVDRWRWLRTTMQTNAITDVTTSVPMDVNNTDIKTLMKLCDGSRISDAPYCS